MAGQTPCEASALQLEPSCCPLFLCWVFWSCSLQNYWPILASILPISASQIARVAGFFSVLFLIISSVNQSKTLEFKKCVCNVGC
jgi:hypothetical protein